jgi:methionine-rich copper-binding protein CopC
MAAVVVALTLYIGLASLPAAAHARLVASTPLANSVVTMLLGEITLTFSEAVKLIAYKVVDSQGQDIKGVGAARVDGNSIYIPVLGQLLDGEYMVNYRIAGTDAHAMNGALTFTIQRTKP